MASTSDHSGSVLLARVEDTFRLCDKRQSPCFFGFLDLQEQAQIRQPLYYQEGWLLFGGYPEAERRLLAVYPPYMQPEDIVYPLCAVAFHYRPERRLSHRDFLGTLLSAGLRRDVIGDILCGEGLSVVFLKEDVVDFVCDEVTKIGGEGVKVTPYYDGELPIARQFKDISETIASPRLDVIIKALLHCSREEAARLIRVGNVSVDHLVTDQVAQNLTAPCTVSVKGSGRYLIDQIGPPTKKGRLALCARKCI